jgi:hypothetical protein
MSKKKTFEASYQVEGEKTDKFTLVNKVISDVAAQKQNAIALSQTLKLTDLRLNSLYGDTPTEVMCYAFVNIFTTAFERMYSLVDIDLYHPHGNIDRLLVAYNAALHLIEQQKISKDYMEMIEAQKELFNFALADYTIKRRNAVPGIQLNYNVKVEPITKHTPWHIYNKS